MPWIFLSLASAVSESLKDTFAKLSSEKTSEYTAAFGFHLISFLLVLPVIVFTGIPDLHTSFWLGSAAFLFITPAWSILYMKSLKISELSKVIPLMAFNPLFTAVLGIIFAQELPTVWGWVGIGCIVAGMYVVRMNVDTFGQDFFEPVRNIIHDRGALYMLGVALLWSLGAHFSKMRVDGSSPLFSNISGAGIGMVTTFLIAQMRHKPIQLGELWQHRRSVGPVGLFYFLATILSSFALQTGSATYVFAIKRGSIVLSQVTGKYVFKEVVTSTKVIGAVAITVGILLLSILG